MVKPRTSTYDAHYVVLAVRTAHPDQAIIDQFFREFQAHNLLDVALRLGRLRRSYVDVIHPDGIKARPKMTPIIDLVRDRRVNLELVALRRCKDHAGCT